MAIRWAIANGNSSSTSTWNDGATLGIPTTGDDVYSNGFTVSMNQDFTVSTLNSVARVRDIATPQMTANNAPSPYVAAASTVNGSNQPYIAFDRVTSGGTGWVSTAATAWISMDFGSSIIIDGYTIYGSTNQTLNPRNWTLEGSDNNVSWNTVHTVTLLSAIAASSTYSIASIGNPTGYRYWRINISLNGNGATIQIPELELYQLFTGAIAAGGSFAFNTAGVTGNVTSSSPLVPGATNLIQVTATTGTVTLTLGGNVAPRNQSNDILINYSGNCNLVLSGGNNFNGAGVASTCINKSSAGLITITGNVNGGNGGGSTGAQSLASANGNTIIIGNVVGGIGGGGSHNAVNQSAGTLTITGNITGGQSIFSNRGVNFSGTQLTVNGNVLGGTAANGIVTSAPINIITGNVTGGTVEAIASTTANQITINGTATASSASPAVSSTNANGQVSLNGNMVNNNGKMAIYAPIVWLGANTTTSAQFFTSGGADRTLYSADTVPNTPAANNVRKGTIYGAGNSLTGTLSMPVVADVRSGVTYDNGSVGTALFTTATLLTEMGSSANPVAVRLRNLATPDILGELMESYKK